MLSTDVQCQGHPFWCYSAQNEINWTGQHPKEAGNLAFSGGGEMLMKWTEIFMGQSHPSGPSFPQGFQHHALPCQTLSSRPNVGRFYEGTNVSVQSAF